MLEGHCIIILLWDEREI